MRNERREQFQQVGNNFVDKAGMRSFLCFFISIQGINQFHHGTDGCVKVKALFNVIRYLFNAGMQHTAQFFASFAKFCRVILRNLFCQHILVVVNYTPYPAKEAE